MSFTNQTIPVPYSWLKKKKPELTREDILDIRSKEQSVEEYMKIHQRSRSTIQDIQRGKTYSEVT